MYKTAANLEKVSLHSSQLRIFFSYMEGPLAEWEHNFVPVVRRWMEEQTRYGYESTNSPGEAELIVFLENNAFKTQSYIAALDQNRLIAEFPNRCFTINYEDTPAGFLPGLYASLPLAKREPTRHRSWSYLFWPSEDLTRRRDSWNTSPNLLFSFRGSANSHALRGRMFAHDFKTVHPFRMTAVDRWFDHTADEKAEYIDELLDSHFCLCPRGIGTTSHRLFEVMALGRCPVILSDEWVPIAGIDWESCSIRIRESDWKMIPEILESRLPSAAELGSAALEVWKSYFSPENVIGEALNQIVEIADSRPPNYDERRFQKVWRTRSFYRLNGWTLEQRIARKFWRRAERLFAN